MGGSIRECVDRYASLVGLEMNKKIAAVVLMATVWFLWLTRNGLIFSVVSPSVNGVVEKILANTFIWLKYMASGRR